MTILDPASNTPKVVQTISQYALPIFNPILNVPTKKATSAPSHCELLQVYEENYQTLRGRKCPSLMVFQGDLPLLEQLLSRWTLDDGICFFDLLGLNIHHDWKNQGATPEDLQRFGLYCKKLSEELLNSLSNPISPNFFRAMHSAFKLLEKNVPPSIQTKFKFLLKILEHPKQALAIGSSPVQFFGCSERLEGVHTERKDVLAFMDFAHQLHPEDLQFLGTTQKDTALSKKLNALLKNIETRSAKMSYADQDKYHFIALLKKIVDVRLLQKKLPISRLFVNLQHTSSFEKSKCNKWILNKIKKELCDNFENLIIDRLLKHFPKDGSPFEMPADEAYMGINSLAHHCLPQKKDSWEKSIIKKLDHQRTICKNPLEYAVIFSDMVRLYQIVHDIGFLQDVTKDQLKGRHIPDSFAQRAFLHNVDTASLNIDPTEDQKPLRQQTEAKQETKSPLSQDVEEIASIPKVKVKKRPTEAEPTAAQVLETNVSAPVVPLIERPDFPMRNVSGRDVMHHLLNNGFVIDRISGSHYQMKHVVTQVATTVPFHESIRPGTLTAIRQAFDLSQGFLH